MANASRIVTKTSQALNNRIIKSPPAAWQALLAHPPPPSLIRDPSKRSPVDLPQAQRKARAEASSRKRKPGRDYKAKLKPQPIVWDEDAIVEKLLADHPWERHRPITVTESAELQNIPAGDNRELASWSRNPSVYLTARYVLHLKEAHKLPLAQAYSSAVSQFRALKATLEAASQFAQLEAEAYGARFGGGRIAAGVKAEEKMLDLWDAENGASTSGDSSSASSSLSALLASSVNDRSARSYSWSGGKDYLRDNQQQRLQSQQANTTAAEGQGDEVPVAESVMQATELMSMLGGGVASESAKAPKTTEERLRSKDETMEAQYKARQRATARQVSEMVGIKR